MGKHLYPIHSPNGSLVTDCWGLKNPAESGTNSPFSPMFNEIRSDKDVCENCFQRTRERYERNYRLETYFDDEDGEWSVRPVDVQGITLTVGNDDVTLGGFDDDVYRRRESTMTLPERGSHRGMRTICDCGFRYSDTDSEEGTWKNRPLDKRTFFDYAEHLVERMDEKGVSYCEDTLFKELDHMKSDPEQQFDDDSIYKKAIERSIIAEQTKQKAAPGSVSG